MLIVIKTTPEKYEVAEANVILLQKLNKKIITIETSRFTVLFLTNHQNQNIVFFYNKLKVLKIYNTFIFENSVSTTGIKIQ